MKRECVIVLGMHRSATSLTAMVLSRMGCYVGAKEDLLPEANDNEKGFYEYKKAFLLNEEILLKNGMFWASIENKDCVADDVDRLKMNIILNELIRNPKHTHILLKDPRMCILEPLWRCELEKYNLKERVVIVFRHPYEVARSLEKRDGINFVYGLKLWYYYNLCILKIACEVGQENSLFLQHDQYFINSNKQIGRIAEFLSLSYDEDIFKCIDGNLFHNTASMIDDCINYNLKKEILKLYETFIGLANENICLSEVDICGFEDGMSELMNTSYLDGQKDMVMYAFGKGNAYFLKEWCLCQIKENGNIVKKGLRDYFHKKNIDKVDIYGNGLLGRALFPVLLELGIDINNVYDINSNITISLGDREYIVKDLKQGNQDDASFILNTVLIKEHDIEEVLRNYYGDNVLSVFRMLYCLR